MGVAGAARALCGAPIAIASPSRCSAAGGFCLLVHLPEIHESLADWCTLALYNGPNYYVLAVYTGCRELNAEVVRCSCSGELPIKLMELCV